MKNQYYISLGLASLISLSLPIVIGLDTLEVDNSVENNETQYQFVTVEGPIQPIPKILSIDKKWVVIGKALFHSPLLSKDNTVSCATCHMVDFGGDDGFPVSTGVEGNRGTRNSPTVLNAVFSFRQFWDGRAKDLAEQAIGPIHNPIEMASNWQQVLGKLNDDPFFSSSFNNLGYKIITEDLVITAITRFEESLITPNSAIDRFLLGDKTALSIQQQRGLALFNEFGCSTCHQGVNIGGNIFQKLGRLDQVPTHLTADLGRYQVTQKESDKHVFKVPSLRNIALTAPYFHDGSVASLEQAVTIMAKSQLGRDLAQNEVDDLVSLLHAFSGEIAEVK